MFPKTVKCLLGEESHPSQALMLEKMGWLKLHAHNETTFASIAKERMHTDELAGE